jgi:DNA-directed RNA polymerase specialized sigma24 family protein
MDTLKSAAAELTDDEKSAVEKQFDTLCKISMANTVKNYFKLKQARAEKETSYDELTGNREPFMYDDYFTGYTLTAPNGTVVNLTDQTLYDAMNMLYTTGMNVILCYYCLDMNDRQIAEMLNIPRSSVTYQRAASLVKLKEILR